MKISDKQKKIALIIGGVVLAVWWFNHRTRRSGTVANAPVDNGTGEAGYATYNMPFVYGSGGNAGSGNSYDFGDINIGTTPNTSAPTMIFDTDALAAKICACSNGCGTPNGNRGNFIFANFQVPQGQGANYQAPLVPYVSGFFNAGN